MASQFSLLNRKTFFSSGDFIWYSDPMYWGGFQRCEAFLSIYAVTNGTNHAIGLAFEGSNEPGFNAIWTTISAGTPADPADAPGTGVLRYVRDGTLYPYVRLRLDIQAASGMRGAEVSVDGTLFEMGNSV